MKPEYRNNLPQLAYNPKVPRLVLVQGRVEPRDRREEQTGFRSAWRNVGSDPFFHSLRHLLAIAARPWLLHNPLCSTAVLEKMTRRTWFWIAVSMTAIALVMALVELPRTPLPWYDEILLVSAARSAALSHPAVPSVLSSFPHTMRSDLFYGPMSFWIGSGTLKLFGLSLWSWRLLDWLSGLAVVLESAWLVLRLTGSLGYAAMGALLVTISPAMGSALTSGRTDTITMSLALFAVCLALLELSVWKSAVSGLFFGAAVLSTPRAHSLALCFFVVSLCYAAIRKEIARLLKLCLAGATALLCVTAWTFHAGLNPVSWYRMVLRASAGDKMNVSPLMGGSWGHVGLDPLLLVLPVGFATWLILWSFRRGKEQPLGRAGELLTAFIANAALYLTLTSRALSYQIFWLVPLIPAAVATTALYVEVDYPKRRRLVAVLVATILIAGALRIGKVTEVIMSWSARDPQPIKDFVCTQVPKNSRVFGPDGPYYYAVEECGSQYLYAGNWTASGLRSPLDGDDPHYQAGDFLLWPTHSRLPRTGALHEVALFGTQTDHAPSRSGLVQLIKRRFPFTGGYPQSILYQVR